MKKISVRRIHSQQRRRFFMGGASFQNSHSLSLSLSLLARHPSLQFFLWTYSFLGGSMGSAGTLPTTRALIYCTKILIHPQDKPATTPASTMFLQGYGNRFTAATIPATPTVTDQLIIIRFLVAWNNPIEYIGAKM